MKVLIECLDKKNCFYKVWEGEVKSISFSPRKSSPPHMLPICQLQDGTIVFPITESIIVRKRKDRIWISKA
jgi:hypothetical protein